MWRFTIILEIFLLFVLPVLWFLLGLGNWQQRLVVFQIFVGLAILLAISHKMSFREMGFRFDNFFKSLKLLLPGTIIFILIIVVFYQFGISSRYYFDNWLKNIFFIYYFLLGAISQEFAYRGYLLVRLKQIFRSPVLIIIVNSLLFSWVHVLHKDISVMIGTFFFGVYLTWVYLKSPNIFAASLVHAIVGALVIIFGFL